MDEAFTKVYQFYCNLCSTNLEGNLLHFRNHISSVHPTEDGHSDEMTKFHGHQKIEEDHFLAINNFLVQIVPESKPKRELRNCMFDSCQFKHLDFAELKAHIHSRHDPYCPHCDYSDQEFMEKHLKTVQHKRRLYTCKKCNLHFSDPDQFWLHRRDQHFVSEEIDENAPQICVFCQRKHKSLKKLFQHVYDHHDPCCPWCNHVNRDGTMPNHFEQFRHVWNDVHSLKCSVWGCVKRFTSLQEYWTHRFEKHPEAMKNLKKPKK